MKESFVLTNKEVHDLWWGLYDLWPDLEPDIFIDYQNTEGKDRFVFGYDSDEPVPGELVAIICREKAIRVLASRGFPPTPEKIKNEWYLFFKNFSLLKKTIVKNPIYDCALVEACKLIVSVKEIDVESNTKYPKSNKPDDGKKT